MRKLAFGALIVGLVACSNSKKPIKIVDAPMPDTMSTCNVLTQMGCMTGQKCSWIVDSESTSGEMGHIGCAPQGSVAAGGSCMRMAAVGSGGGGYDNCMGGAYCDLDPFGIQSNGSGPGLCKTICDPAGGSPACSGTTACDTYDGLFGTAGQTSVAGICDTTCNPLTENDFFDGSGTSNRTTFACGSAKIGSGFGSNCPLCTNAQEYGCYGGFDGTTTKWTCTVQLNPTRVHRAACTTTAATGDLVACGVSVSGGTAGYVNGCAPGYEPLFTDMEGSSQRDCMALCSPALCYNAGSGATSDPTTMCGGANSPNLTGSGAHQCQTTNLRYSGTFTPASGTGTTGDGEQCAYSWWFAVDANNNFVFDPATGDSVGYCFNHGLYNWDYLYGSNGPCGADCGSTIPKCNQIGIGSNGYGVVNGMLDAASIGCVDHTTAGVMFGSQVKGPRPDAPRMPYHMTMGRPPVLQ